MFSFDKSFLYIFIAIAVIRNLMGYISNPDSLMGLIVSLPAVIIAMTFHEFAHAFAADKLGDDTPRVQGRLNLNPLSHIDPAGFFMLLFAGFGWGKPVQINPRKFKREITMSKGEAIVSVAGPLMNIILALIFSLILGAGFKFNWFINIPNSYSGIIITFLYQAIFMNIGLGVFNLIPLPPLDGSKIFRHFLPTKAQIWLDNYEYIFYYIFIALLLTRTTGRIIAPVINIIAKGIMFVVSKIFGIDMIIISEILGLF